MKKALYIFALIFSFSCTNQQTEEKVKGKENNKSSNHPETKTSHLDEKKQTEDKIFNLIYNIPEVKERAEYVEKQTNGERHLSMRIDETFDKTYSVVVGEDNGDAVVTHFTFEVNPKNFEIKNYDVINDTLISLSEWQKRRKEENIQ